MCGVALSIATNSVTARELMEACLEQMKRRGPDARGVDALGEAVLGHVRLSIIDLTGSKQPLLTDCGRFGLVFNGEIYNYQALRASLDTKWKFCTDGDTEVLLAGMVLEGPSFLKRMEGMWAFGLWDNQEKTLLLSRDRSGKKPLYYFADNKALICASELPALTKLHGESFDESSIDLLSYFEYGYMQPGRTAYKGVKEVKPGEYLVWSNGKVVKEENYWRLSPRQFRGSKKEAADELRERFYNAVKLRLVSDVEVGTFLSGGIDSSLVTAVASESASKKIQAFSIGFSDPSHDETVYSKNVAEFLGVSHHVHRINEWDSEIFTFLLKNSVGQPFYDSSIIPSWHVSNLAAQNVKVVLSGDGADELFCGYERYKARAIINWYLRAPRMLRDAFKKMLLRFPEPTAHHSRSLLKKAHLFLGVVDRIESETPYCGPRIFSAGQLERLLSVDVSQRVSDLDRGEASLAQFEEIQAMMFSDFSMYIPQDIHQKVDRASMACSLEVRSPFLDSSLVEFAFSLPQSWHFSYTKNKPMLQHSMSDLLPADIWTRRKQGFAAPVGLWMKGRLGDELEKYLAQLGETMLNPVEVKRMLHEHRNNMHDHTYRLWLIYVYLLWKITYK